MGDDAVAGGEHVWQAGAHRLVHDDRAPAPASGSAFGRTPTTSTTRSAPTLPSIPHSTKSPDGSMTSLHGSPPLDTRPATPPQT